MAGKKGYYRCAVFKCFYEGPEEEFKDAVLFRACPKCRTEDVFPSDDPVWEETKPHRPDPDPFDFDD